MNKSGIRSKRFWNWAGCQGWVCQHQVSITVLNLLLVLCSTLFARAQHPCATISPPSCTFLPALSSHHPHPCSSFSINTHMAIAANEEADIERQSPWSQTRNTMKKNMFSRDTEDEMSVSLQTFNESEVIKVPGYQLKCLFLWALCKTQQQTHAGSHGYVEVSSTE